MTTQSVETEIATEINWPDADDLDTGAARADYKIALFLVPAEESSSGRVTVVAHGYVGAASTPMPAWHGRWYRLLDYGSGVVGESVLEGLRRHESKLLALAERYLGSEWDGSNHKGRWDDDEYNYSPVADLELRTCWDAGDWFEGAGWESLCRDFGIDIERGRTTESAKDAADEIARLNAARHTDAMVAGVEEYVINQAEEWREQEAE